MFKRTKTCEPRWLLSFSRSSLIAGMVAGMLLAPSAVVHGQGRPVKVTLVQNIEFGVLAATAVSGTATVRSDGAKTVSAGIVDLGGVSQPAVFLIQGERFGGFSITLPASATMTLPGGPTAVLSDFESEPAISGVFDHRGQATISVGATMHLAPGLWEGIYGGPFDITVSYQ